MAVIALYIFSRLYFTPILHNPFLHKIYAIYIQSFLYHQSNTKLDSFYKKGIYDILSSAILYHYKVDTYMANSVNYFSVLQSLQANWRQRLHLKAFLQYT